jgi:NADH-quinone oxidoreductase subunit L
LTAFYSWRLLIMAFHGAPRASAQVMSHVHESPKVMTLPLLVLAIGAVFAGWLCYELFVGHDMKQFWGASIFILPTNTAMEDAHHVPTWVKLLPIVLASSGVALAVLFYAYWTSMPMRIAAIFRPIYLLFYNKWYFDELYDAIFVRPAVRFGAYLWQRGDRDTIDGFGPDGMSAFIYRLSGMCSRVQTGFVFHYAFAMLIGVVVLVSWYYFRFKGA